MTKDNKNFKCEKVKIYQLFLYFFVLIFSIYGEITCAGAISWSNIGPGGGGYITAIKFDPVNAEIIYVGTDVGGMYVSYDSGSNWVIKNQGLSDYYIQCIDINPKNNREIIIGTRGGIFKSTNQANLWEVKRDGFPSDKKNMYTAPVNSIAYDPINPSYVYAGIGYSRMQKYGNGRVFISHDSGESWKGNKITKNINENTIVGDIEVSNDGRYILASTNNGIYRSVDHGVSWGIVNKGLPHDYSLNVKISQKDTSIVYATLMTTSKGKEPWNGGVYKSDDSGINWKISSFGLPQKG